ncbi:fmnh2-dependent monooxygenase [Ceraceosorus bombacis]|uniref:Fmnh2-dependent monooxygenase n=1 Tax=Ceraceosorus bombacis TaxID=401625 RepID=A0A0P1BDZ4_9BASI|nr:fmnh2-dependent monooxygenase [Ceraceosorus bombacis]
MSKPNGTAAASNGANGAAATFHAPPSAGGFSRIQPDPELVSYPSPTSWQSLLGYNYIWFWAAALVGTDEQRERIEQWLTQNKYFLGGAVNPRDADLHITKLGADGELDILEGTFAGESADAPHVNTRGWPYTPTPAARGTDEVYIQEGYGTLQARLWASEAQFDNVVGEASALLHTSPRPNVTAEQRSHLAIQVAAAKVVIADLGLEITSKVYEYMGARAVSGKYGFDVAFRDLRTHTLHDPIAHKRSEVGRFALNGQGPEPHAT